MVVMRPELKELEEKGGLEGWGQCWKWGWLEGQGNRLEQVGSKVSGRLEWRGKGEMVG